MPTVDELLNMPVDQLDYARVEHPGVTSAMPATTRGQAKRLGYVAIPGVINLSYSRLQVLHSCPRKFYLREIAQKFLNWNQTVHTAFGSAMGAGIQELFRTNSLELAVIAAFANWSIDITEEDYRSNKSVWTVINGLELFYKHYYPSICENYELAYLDGKPCIELFFLIRINERYNTQGHIDLILRNKHTGKFVVLELKTTSRESHEADWMNSEQTLGYSVIVDALAKAYEVESGFEVEYLIYNPSPKLANPEQRWGFTNFTFEKSANTKADFVLDTLLDVQTIDMYLSNNFFPKRGNACRAFNRVCEYFGTCDSMFQDLINTPILELHRQAQDENSAYETMSEKDVDFIVECDTLLQQLAEVDEDSSAVDDIAIDDIVRSAIVKDS